MERPIQVLSHSPLVCNGVDSFADSAYYTHRGGAGVFNAGTMRWVESFGPPLYHWGLTGPPAGSPAGSPPTCCGRSPTGPAAARYPARDNLARIHEHVGDPVTAGTGL